MTRKKLFKIVTLSDCLNCNENINLGQPSSFHSYGQSLQQGGGMDPVTIITGGLAIVQQFFPNLFGGGRKKLTSADWNQLIPGNGSWTVRLRNRLAETINYDSDLGNIELYTRYFVIDNKNQICGAGVSDSECYKTFLGILKQETFSGGSSPVGNVPGYFGTIDYQSLIPYAIGAVALVYILKNKKRK